MDRIRLPDDGRMKATSRQERECPHCQKFFEPDYRHRERQRYCSDPACQRARRASNWRRWFAKPENQRLYGGSENVKRVQQWRAAHPGYWRRPSKPKDALQIACTAGIPAIKGSDSDTDLVASALHIAIRDEKALFLGLLAHLAGSALPIDIAKTSRRLIDLGNDVLKRQPHIAMRSR